MGTGVRKGLSSVLTPDNEGGPKGLGISMEGKGACLALEVDAESLATVVSTAIALLRDIALFEEIWLLLRSKDAMVTEKATD